MTKARLHPSLIEFHGAMGDMLFRQRNGKVFASIKSKGSSYEASPAQAAHRARFRKAVRYGRSVLADDDVREIYEAVSERTGTPVFALTIADFMKPPSISEWDASAYKGQIGDLIEIVTIDNVGVLSLHVNITDEQGTSLDSGYAVDTSGNGDWVYTAKTAIPAGETITFNAVAKDRPGNTAVYKSNKTL
jgi:hypothetical protein